MSRHRFSVPRASSPLLVCLLLTGSTASAVADDKPADATVIVQGLTGDPVRFTDAELKKLPRVDVEVSDHGKKATYSGVALRTLLDRAGVAGGEKLRGKWLGTFVTIDALDGYRAVYGLPELDPAFNAHTIILADLRDGKPLDKKHAPFQVIAPGDKRAARWVYGVKEIRVIDSRAEK